MAQRLILFENIVNGEAIKSNQSLQAELEKLAEYVFGESDYQIEDAKENGDDVQGWSNDELYKAIVNDYCTAFRFKSAFEINGEGYAGPVMGWFFEPDGALDDQIVVLTCESNGLFKNPRYVCGMLMDEDDLERMFGDYGDNDEEEDEKDDDEEELDDDDEYRVVDGKCIFLEGVTEIEDEVFSEDCSIVEVEIPESVEVIGYDAFSYCRSLKTVRILGPLKKIEDSAFMECSSLVNINLPDTLTYIGEQAFSGCTKLREIKIPDSVKVINEDAFEDCPSLERIYIKNPRLLEDTGLEDDVQIITDSDKKDIPDPARRPARKYVFQYAINATVGQLVKDLNGIKKQAPDSFISTTLGNGSEVYVRSVRLWNGIIILRTCGDDEDAMSVADLLEELKGQDNDTQVVLELGWRLVNLSPKKNGSVIWYDDDDECCWINYENDIRLFKVEDLSELVRYYAKKCPDRKVVCLADDGIYYPVADVYEDDGDGFVIVRKMNDGKGVTISKFANSLGDDEVVLFFENKSETAVYKAVGAVKSGVFFEDVVDGEDVIAFHLGETLYDERIEDDSDDEFWNDDDTVVTLDDLCDKEEEKESVVEKEPDVEFEPESEVIKNEKLKSSVLQSIQEIKEKEKAAEAGDEGASDGESSKNGDYILKLVSYEGSVIKMMTVLSSIEGIDEEAAFCKLQKLPSVVLEGLSVKKAMEIGTMLEEAGAKVDLARASDPVPEDLVPESSPKPSPKPGSKHAPKPTPASLVPEKPKQAPMEYVDLGLSVKWAKCNLGASVPEEFGDYFAWGETEKHDFTDNRKYKFSGKGGLTKYNTKEAYGNVVDNIKQLELSDDAAHQILGDGWRMPTIKEMNELRLNCKVSKTVINGVPGEKYTSKVKGYTDKWIFLPGAGEWVGDSHHWKGTCRYWTSTLYTRRPDCAMMLMDEVGEEKTYRSYSSLSIRAVTK